jgi:hypothetical protein
MPAAYAGTGPGARSTPGVASGQKEELVDRIFDVPFSLEVRLMPSCRHGLIALAALFLVASFSGATGADAASVELADRPAQLPGARDRSRRRPAPLRRRAGRPHPALRPGRHLARHLPEHLRDHLQRRRARPAGPGLRAGLRRERPLLRQLHQPERRHRDRPLPGQRRGPGPRRSRQRRAVAAGRPALQQPQRRPYRVRPGRHALHRPGRRRQRRRPRQLRPEPAPRSWARCCAWTSPAPAATRSRRTTRSWATRAPATRSGPWACATPGSSASTARPATSTSPTSARARARRSACSRPPPRAARTTAGA